MADVERQVLQVDAEADHRGLVADGVDAVERGVTAAASRTSPCTRSARASRARRPAVRRARRAAARRARAPRGRLGQQRVHDVRADEAGSAGDEDAHPPDASARTAGPARRPSSRAPRRRPASRTTSRRSRGSSAPSDGARRGRPRHAAARRTPLPRRGAGRSRP